MTKPPPRTTPKIDPLEDRPYLPGDPIPVGDAVEKDTETTWKLFQELAAKQDMHYADTVPIEKPERPRDPSAKAVIRPAERPAITLESVLREATRANRVCPKPDQWQGLHELLASGQEPGTVPAPLIGEAWAGTPALAKRMCLKNQIQWAAEHGLTMECYRYLKRLSEDEWHHMGS